MVTGSAPTTDDGKVKVIISYEDENGEVSEVEKELMPVCLVSTARRPSELR